jgi:hypothetical protein
MGFHLMEPLFPLGRLLVSDHVVDSIPDYMRYLRRHQSGDWGSVCEHNAWENQKAVSSGDEILSMYPVTLADGATKDLCVMTEKSRTYTVIFFVSESTSI